MLALNSCDSLHINIIIILNNIDSLCINMIIILNKTDSQCLTIIFIFNYNDSLHTNLLIKVYTSMLVCIIIDITID